MEKILSVEKEERLQIIGQHDIFSRESARSNERYQNYQNNILSNPHESNNKERNNLEKNSCNHEHCNT